MRKELIRSAASACRLPLPFPLLLPILYRFYKLGPISPQAMKDPEEREKAGKF